MSDEVLVSPASRYQGPRLFIARRTEPNRDTCSIVHAPPTMAGSVGVQRGADADSTPQLLQLLQLELQDGNKTLASQFIDRPVSPVSTNKQKSTPLRLLWQ
ncbi:hypothetical protein MN608_01889 [Microdochium nivale]|nr:hypothetical protein MN608_01889 [Microdochium nivale]